MQTFIPYESIVKSVQCLDNKRLGKQRVECKQILQALSGEKLGWVNHPAVKMWRGYENLLKLYYNQCLHEWEKRGFKNIKLQKIRVLTGDLKIPPWWGREDIHQSHRANLIRKDEAHYSQFFNDNPQLGYVWPV